MTDAITLRSADQTKIWQSKDGETVYFCDKFWYTQSRSSFDFNGEVKENFAINIHDLVIPYQEVSRPMYDDNAKPMIVSLEETQADKLRANPDAWIRLSDADKSMVWRGMDGSLFKYYEPLEIKNMWISSSWVVVDLNGSPKVENEELLIIAKLGRVAVRPFYLLDSKESNA